MIGISTDKNTQGKCGKQTGDKDQQRCSWFFHGIGPPGLTIKAKADIIQTLYTTFYRRTSPVLDIEVIL
jgi:hypothetical protein